MKFYLILGAIPFLALSADSCGDKKKDSGVYKGKLETKALCMNYTLRITEGNVDTSLVAANWTDENTGKSYKNAFALANPCSFPDSIQQGEEFFFSIASSDTTKCAVCMAYYPTPPKKLAIKVVEK